jgi:hypothetical protein
MYDANELLDTIDTHTVPILVLFGLAMVCQTIAMVSAVRVSAREQVISIPLFCTFFWFAHDVGYVVRFHEWFVVYDHWFLKCFWVGLFSAMLLELVFFAQAIRYGRKEFMPQATERQFALLVAGGAIAWIVGWEFFKLLAADPLYQAAAALTLFALPIAGVAQMLRRRSVAGQTVAVWGGFTAMVPLWWAVTVYYYGDGFRSWQYVSLGVVAFVMFVAVTTYVARARQDWPAPGSAQPGPEVARPASLSGSPLH